MKNIPAIVEKLQRLSGTAPQIERDALETVIALQRRVADLEAVEAMRDQEIAHLREKHGAALAQIEALTTELAGARAAIDLYHAKVVELDRDAARYRVVRQAAYHFGVSNPMPDEVDEEVDKARAALSATKEQR